MHYPRSIGTALVLASVIAIANVFSVASAQPTIRSPRVGVLSPAGAAEYAAAADAFRQGLSDRGYVEGKNLSIEYRWAEGKPARLPGFAAELVRLNVDLIVAHAIQAALAAKEATTTLPIVMVATFDPVRSGLVASLARPGGNVTGLAYPESMGELSGKWIQLLNELVPKLARVAVLTNVDNPSHERRLRDIEATGRVLRIDIQKVEMQQLDLERALASVGRLTAGALIVMPDPIFTNQ